ncbi:MAG: type II toxin-antitoxin system HicB family antitoxin, partial [Solirubrobacteraceae bacterium]
DEARDMATEALAFHLEGLAEDGEAVPEPSALEEIMSDAENRDGVAVLISALSPSKAFGSTSQSQHGSESRLTVI